MTNQEATRKSKIRKGDKVLVIAGNDRGSTGTVLGFKGPDRLIVQGVNMRKKHVRKSQQAPQGDIITIETPIHISNVRLCTEEGNPIKISVRVDSDGSRHLVYQKESNEVIYRTLQKKRG